MLQVDTLNVRFTTPAGEIAAVRDWSFDVQSGECVAVVGESGAGKSQAFLAMLGLLAPNGQASGTARFEGVDLLRSRRVTLNSILGRRIAIILQDPASSLTPHLKIGRQITEPMIHHLKLGRRAAEARALHLLERMAMPDARLCLNLYPHELSGGMRQRAVIAIALACDPSLLIADEPTTSLDTALQTQILALLSDLQRERQMSLVLITHDLDVAADIADRMMVVREGRLIETSATINHRPSHPAPADDVLSFPSHNPVLEVNDLTVDYAVRQSFRRPIWRRALSNIQAQLLAGEAVGIVGESGSGKTTLARAVLELIRPSRGRIVWFGRQQIDRRGVQMIFQDPMESLNPRMTVRDIVAEPLRIHRADIHRDDIEREVETILGRVSLGPEMMRRYPHELSGGQIQRVAIARAVILKPKILVCDEPASSLDISTQASILELLRTLQREHGMTMLFISHNLVLVRALCSRVLMLRQGCMVGFGATGTLLSGK